MLDEPEDIEDCGDDADLDDELLYEDDVRAIERAWAEQGDEPPATLEDVRARLELLD